MKKAYWRMGLMLVVALALVEASTSAPAFATPSPGRRPLGTITGSVLDSRGNPLAGALVTVLRDGFNEVVKQTRSDSDGNFVARVAPGRYLIRALADGFNPATFTAVSVNSSSELVYKFNLQPAGEGRTAPERRADRNDPKFKIRSQMSRRSIFQAGEGPDAAADAAQEAIAANAGNARDEDSLTIDDNAAAGDESGATDATDATDARRRSRTRTQGVVETFYAASSNPQLGNYSGLNFALATPVNRQFDLIFSGQIGEFERLDATARVRASAHHRLSTTFGSARLPVSSRRATASALAANETTLKHEKETLGQFSVRAVDEWVVRDGVVVVVGLDYSRFMGAGSDDSLAPRLGFELEANPRTRLRAAYAPGQQATTHTQSVQMFEDGPVAFQEPTGQFVALVDGKAVMERSRRLEFGVERVLDDNSSIEATAFFDTTDGRGVGLFSIPLSGLTETSSAALINVANQQGGARGLRVVYTRRISQHLRASAGYAVGRGQQLAPEGITNPEQLFQNAYFQTAAAQVDANVFEGTTVRTVLRFSPRAAVFAIDPFAGRLAVYDPSLSILVTQELPNFGLPLRAQAMFDARNLFDTLTGVDDGDSQLSVGSARRMVRGGISVRF